MGAKQEHADHAPRSPKPGFLRRLGSAAIEVRDELAKLRAEGKALKELRRNAPGPFHERVVMEAMWNTVSRINAQAVDYEWVVGDDVRGRLPAIAFAEFINIRRRQAGLPLARLSFLNGKYGGAMPADFYPPAAGRRLVVTDHIDEGKSLANISGILGAQPGRGPEEGLDVVALQSSLAFEELPLPKGSNLYAAPWTLMEPRVDDFVTGEAMRHLTGREQVEGSPYSRVVPDHDQRAVSEAESYMVVIAQRFSELLPAPTPS